jgi:hypothetical protein
MESFEINHTDKGLKIEGIPDAHMVVKLQSQNAQKIADLCLHKHDLEFALSSLEAINTIADNHHIREALWRSAITHFFKCFGKSERFRLQKEDVLAKEEPMALEIFEYFKALRNKHFVHDENSYAQSLPCIVLNNGNKSYKVEKIVCLATLIPTLEQSNWSNLRNLISKTLIWVIYEFDALTEKETVELEAMSYEQLTNMNPAVWKKPTVEDVYIKRN